MPYIILPSKQLVLNEATLAVIKPLVPDVPDDVEFLAAYRIDVQNSSYRGEDGLDVYQGDLVVILKDPGTAMPKFKEISLEPEVLIDVDSDVEQINLRFAKDLTVQGKSYNRY